VLAHSRMAPRGARLTTSVSGADTAQHVLCHGEQSDGQQGPLMQTDSEAMLQAGNALLARTWERFQVESGWTADAIDRVVTHQVGVQHRRLVLSTLGLGLERDFPTVETCGNVGSVSLPLSYTLAREQGFLARGQRLAMLGIGSGLQCQILGLEL
jgi:3-oxoacyl-[acyl-carrier-protein] synthase III